jgi:hypothetical protein
LKTTLLYLFLFFTFQYAFGQDRIFTSDGNLLNVNIVNESEKAFNYVTNTSDTVSILTIYKNHISRIEFANGAVNMMGNQNPRKIRPLGINIGYGFSKTETYMHHFRTYTEQEISMITAGIDYFLIPQIDLNANMGTSSGKISYFSAGFDFHINSNNSKTGLTPFAGISGGAILLNSYSSGTGFGQVHLGLNYLSKFGLNFAAMENFLLNNNNNLPFFTEFRIGWKFKV